MHLNCKTKQKNRFDDLIEKFINRHKKLNDENFHQLVLAKKKFCDKTIDFDTKLESFIIELML